MIGNFDPWFKKLERSLISQKQEIMKMLNLSEDFLKVEYCIFGVNSVKFYYNQGCIRIHFEIKYSDLDGIL